MAKLICDECATPPRPGDTVCRVDGSPLREVGEPDCSDEASSEPGDYCDECGARLRPTAELCAVCGTPRPTRLTEPEETSLATEVPQRPGGDPWASDVAAVSLVVSSHLGSREVTVYPGDAIQIGRSVGPFTDLAADNISGEHATITIGNDAIHVVDTGSDGRGSTNGTYIDGVRLAANEPTLVRDGVTVTCAQDPPLTIQVGIER